MIRDITGKHEMHIEDREGGREMYIYMISSMKVYGGGKWKGFA